MNILETGRKVLEIEADSIEKARLRLDGSFEEAVSILVQTEGRVVVTGMGKSGLIGKKISATMTSTGTPSVFLHPSEALHGDLGIITEGDTVLALSTSGETDEVVKLINYIKRIGVKLIALTGKRDSTLSSVADVFIDCSIDREACPTGLVPTASSTLTLALGDALAVSLMEKKGFGEEDFRLNHPGGNIGRKLLKVKHLMHKDSALPVVCLKDSMAAVMKMIDSKRMGVAIVTDNDGRVAGVITDGDLRRQFLKGGNLKEMAAENCMTENPLTISKESLSVEALNLMEEYRITSLPVADENRVLLGILHLHDLWRTEMI